MPRYFALFFVVFASFLSLAQALPVKIQVISTLDKFEPFDAHLFHAGHLWVGRARSGLGAHYKLEVYRSDGTLVVTKDLDHSPRFLYAFDSQTVLTVGISYVDNLSHYTLASLRGSQVTTRSFTIPADALANEWAGRPGALYFTDPGGLDDGSPIDQPLKTVFTLRLGRPRFINARVRGARDPILVGDNLYLIEHPSIASGGRTLLRFNTRTEALTPIAQGSDFSEILAAHGHLFVSDRGAGNVIVVDLAQGSVVKTLAINTGTPRALTLAGSCLIVGSEESNRISFFRWRDLPGTASIGEWDLSPLGASFTKIRKLAVDPLSFRVYARSAYPTSATDPAAESGNAVVMMEESEPKVAAACTN